MKRKITAGIISDTHGLLRPEVLTIFKDADMILHAGDNGNKNIITNLEKIAPVTAIRGNIDNDPEVAKYPETKILTINDKKISGKCR